MSLKRSSSLIFFTFIILILSNSNSISLEKKIFNFNDGNLKKFKKHSIKGETNYEIIKENNNAYLKAKANGTASGLGVEKKIDLNETPFLNISWKLEKGLIGINEKSKKGHDFALRVFVIKSTGKLPWKKKVINYVFSSNEISHDYTVQMDMINRPSVRLKCHIQCANSPVFSSLHFSALIVKAVLNIFPSQFQVINLFQ